MTFLHRAECGCPQTHTGVTVHRTACTVRIGTPRVFPPTPVEEAQARMDIQRTYSALGARASYLGRIAEMQGGISPAEVDEFIEWAKQRLHVIALARAVLPSDDGKANPTND